MDELVQRMLQPIAKAKGTSVESLIDEHPEELKRGAIASLAEVKGIPAQSLTSENRAVAIALAIRVFHESELIEIWRWCRHEGTSAVVRKAAHGVLRHSDNIRVQEISGR